MDKQEIISLYKKQLDILELIINDMSNINIQDIQDWIDDTYKELEKV